VITPNTDDVTSLPVLHPVIVITLANEVFGFNGWSSQIISLATDFVSFHSLPRLVPIHPRITLPIYDHLVRAQCDETSPGRYSVGVSAIIRVTLRDGTFHEDTGFGGGDNLKGKGSSLDKVSVWLVVAPGTRGVVRDCGGCGC
jgi:DNA repair and recombination protein RAD52